MPETFFSKASMRAAARIVGTLFGQEVLIQCQCPCVRFAEDQPKVG